MIEMAGKCQYDHEMMMMTMTTGDVEGEEKRTGEAVENVVRKKGGVKEEAGEMTIGGKRTSLKEREEVPLTGGRW